MHHPLITLITLIRWWRMTRRAVRVVTQTHMCSATHSLLFTPASKRPLGPIDAAPIRPDPRALAPLITLITLIRSCWGRLLVLASVFVLFAASPPWRLSLALSRDLSVSLAVWGRGAIDLKNLALGWMEVCASDGCGSAPYSCFISRSHAEMHSRGDALARRCTHAAMHSRGDALTRRCTHAAMHSRGEALTRRCTHAAMHSRAVY
jgi:hypothetical protein